MSRRIALSPPSVLNTMPNLPTTYEQGDSSRSKSSNRLLQSQANRDDAEEAYDQEVYAETEYALGVDEAGGDAPKSEAQGADLTDALMSKYGNPRPGRHPL